MLKTLYVEDQTRGAVKIIKRGKVWAVYRLDQVIVARDGKRTFKFENRAFETWSYPPFEDKDVHGSAELLDFDFIRRWTPHLVQHSVL